MGKTKLQSLGTLVVGGLVFYLAFWLYQPFGWIGPIAVGCVFAAACMGKMMLVRRRNNASFEKLIRFLLVKRMSSQQAALLDASMTRKNPQRAELINKIRQLHDAMETALSSKQRAAAQAGMQSVRDLYGEIRAQHAPLLSAQLTTEIDDVVSKHEQVYNTRLYTNVAEGLLERAGRVEDTQTRMQYTALALETLEEGAANPKSENEPLEAMRRKVEQKLQRGRPESDLTQFQQG